MCLRSTLEVIVLKVGGMEVLAEQANLADYVASNMSASPAWMTSERDRVWATFTVKLL